MTEQKMNRIPHNKAAYILRYYLPEEPYVSEKITKQRFCELLDFCKKNEIEAVMFYVAFKSEWYYQPDQPDHARNWARRMRPFADALRRHGISYQLNFQNLMGAIPGGADFRKEYSWEFLTDSSGRENTGCACPLGPRFRENMGIQLKYWAETQPDVIWLDDDFRLHNHGTSAFYEAGGKELGERDWFCYCDMHMELFNRRYGHSLSREELLQEILSPGIPSNVRKEWLDFLADTMAEAAGWVRRTVEAVSPSTLLAQMTSIPDVHAAEGRRWDRFLTELTGGRYPAILRSHFGPYAEQSPLEFVDCMLLADQLLANISAQYGQADYWPEIENTRYTAWSKSVAATRYQLYLSQLLGFPGVTLSLYDLEGSPLDEEPGYGRLLGSEKPSLDLLASLQFSQWEKRGVVLITDPENAMKKVLLNQGSSPEALVGIRTWDKVLAQMGIPVYYRTPKEALAEETLIAVDGNSIFCFSKQQQAELVKKKLFLDGLAAEVLWRSGFSEDTGIVEVEDGRCTTSAEIFHDQRHGDQTEKRMPNRLAPMEWREFLISDEVEVLSTIVLCDGRRVPGLCRFHNGKGGEIWFYPVTGSVEKGFYNHARASQFHGLVRQADGTIPMLYANRPCITVCRQKGQSVLAAVSILSPDGAEDMILHVPAGKRLKAIYRQTGSTFTEMESEEMKDAAEIHLHLPGPALLYEWVILILKVQ